MSCTRQRARPAGAATRGCGSGPPGQDSGPSRRQTRRSARAAGAARYRRCRARWAVLRRVRTGSGPAPWASGGKGGVLPWALLVAGSVASLAANVAVAEPTLIGRAIAAWPSFALTASYELLTRQVRHGAAQADSGDAQPRQLQNAPVAAVKRAPTAGLRLVPSPELGKGSRRSGSDLQRQAWKWALANRAEDDSLPSGSTIARAHGRRERWGRLVKNAGAPGTDRRPGTGGHARTGRGVRR
jgi:hypothetical protein